MQIFHIQGPVGSGKSITIRAFCILYSLLFTGNIVILSTQNAPCNKFCADMFETSEYSNIHFTRVASRDQIAKLREKKVPFLDCLQGSGNKTQRHMLNNRKTNVIISTVGMTPQSHNNKGTMELVIPCEAFDVVFQDEKQNENGQNLLLMPCFLKPSSIAVLFDDKTQTPPHQPRIFRPSRVQDLTVTPVETHDLRDVHMSIASSPFRPLMKKKQTNSRMAECAVGSHERTTTFCR